MLDDQQSYDHCHRYAGLRAFLAGLVTPVPIPPRGSRQARCRFEQLEARQMLDGGGLSDTDPPSEGDQMQMVPDFALVDVNATSPTYGQVVSPRDSLGHVTAWYFGHGL